MSAISLRSCVITLLTASCLAPTAFAHITLELQQAPIDSHYKAVFQVPHGCHGSATTRLLIRIPDGVVGVKPQPKADWKVDTVQGEYGKTYIHYGREVSSGVTEVSWSGGKLLNEHYDEFVLIGYLSGDLEPDTTLHFPVVQECEQGATSWLDVGPVNHDAGDGHSYSPAPGLKLLPKQ